jgi:hypothetical protein
MLQEVIGQIKISKFVSPHRILLMLESIKLSGQRTFVESAFAELDMVVKMGVQCLCLRV